jgi:hypothetical protein
MVSVACKLSLSLSQRLSLLPLINDHDSIRPGGILTFPGPVIRVTQSCRSQAIKTSVDSVADMCVFVYYCSTYFKAVRVGGGG